MVSSTGTLKVGDSSSFNVPAGETILALMPEFCANLEGQIEHQSKVKRNCGYPFNFVFHYCLFGEITNVKYLCLMSYMC